MDANRLPKSGNLPPPHGYKVRISANLSPLIGPIGYVPPPGRVNREVGMDANRLPKSGNLPPPHGYKVRISANLSPLGL